MRNLTWGKIHFNLHGDTLGRAVRQALSKAVDISLETYDLSAEDLASVTTKRMKRATFAAFVTSRVLRAKKRLGDAYVNTAFAAYQENSVAITEAQFRVLMQPASQGTFCYKQTYAKSLRVGLGLFLIALHSSGAITLPCGFRWPSAGRTKRIEVGNHVCSELLGFLRQLNSQDQAIPHPAFNAVGTDRQRREWFLSYGTKLLLATGWHTPEDINIEDLIEIKSAVRELTTRRLRTPTSISLPYKLLLQVLVAAFGDRTSVKVADWGHALEMTRPLRTLLPMGYPDIKVLEHNADIDLKKVLAGILAFPPRQGSPDRIAQLRNLPHLDFDMPTSCRTWISLENLYIAKTARESYKGMIGALGYWNIYLFYYLPYWFSQHPGPKFSFPDAPSLLLKSIFVSRLTPLDEVTPLTFVEFLDLCREAKRWKNARPYSILLDLFQFFEFIESNNSELPGAEGFEQPLSNYDFPRIGRSTGTDKMPISRQFFSSLLAYFETLLNYLYVVSERILTRSLDDSEIEKLMAFDNFIDTFSMAYVVGYVPVLILPGRVLPLQFIPNVLDIRLRAVKGLGAVMLPHPHALHQNIVSLHTGLRNNHIQWLDRRTFDSRVDEDATEFANLFVNTDKTKSSPWTPLVNIRVIEILRSQKAWLSILDEPSALSEHFYNYNSKTKWDMIAPLFSYAKDGKPHWDSIYYNTWRDVICGFQGILSEVTGRASPTPLVRLLPPGCQLIDVDLQAGIERYGRELPEGAICELGVKSRHTPHSARVTVVTHNGNYLSFDLIGKYFTGQTPATVAYYFKLEEESLLVEKLHQGARLKELALRNALEPTIGESSVGGIRADAVNSHLAQSLRQNFDETIVAYGCFSLSFREGLENGLDVFRRTRGEDAVANLTEICPYGNICPKDVLIQLRGVHRCSLCDYAVRCVDHLPAVLAKQRQIAELVDDLERQLSIDGKYSPQELDAMESERGKLCEELAGWKLNEEILEINRRSIAAGQHQKTWIVRKPEIIERDLKRVVMPTSMSEYVLSRLGDCVTYPVTESPQIRARFDLIRREMLASSGNLAAAFSPAIPVDPVAECAGLLRTVIESTGLSISDLAKKLDDNDHLRSLPPSQFRLLAIEAVEDDEWL